MTVHDKIIGETLQPKMTESKVENRLALWQERWSSANGDPSWHKINVSDQLIKYLDVLQNGKEHITILFPLCGKSVDLGHCYNLGHTVIGVEAIEEAVEELFANDDIDYDKTFSKEIDGYIYKVRSNIKRLSTFKQNIYSPFRV